MPRFQRRHWAALALIAGAALCLWLIAARSSTELTFLAVGQGDAILIESGGQAVLIDGGPDRQLLSALARQLPFWQRRLAAVVLTHDHEDHLFGLLELSPAYQVEQAFIGTVSSSQPALALWRQRFQPRVLQVGDELKFGDCRLLVLLAEPGSGNRSSVVSRLDCGRFSALLTGDAETAQEVKLLNAGQLSPVQVLKLAHHGSDTANSQAWLQALRPQLAVISVGAGNRYGHPSTRVINRLQRLGLAWQTTLAGDVRLRIDPGSGDFRLK